MNEFSHPGQEYEPDLPSRNDAAALRAAPRITDNDVGEITATIAGVEVRGWSYKDDAERRIKMRMAHEFAEGWWQAVNQKGAALAK